MWHPSVVLLCLCMHAISKQKLCQHLFSKHFQQDKLNKDLEYLNSSKDDERYTSKVSKVYRIRQILKIEWIYNDLVLIKLTDVGSKWPFVGQSRPFVITHSYRLIKWMNGHFQTLSDSSTGNVARTRIIGYFRFRICVIFSRFLWSSGGLADLELMVVELLPDIIRRRLKLVFIFRH